MNIEAPISVAFIDDDEALRRANVQTLQLAGFTPLPFASATAALAAIDAGFPGIVVSDVRMPHIDGLELFRRVKAIDPDLPVILISGHGDIDMAVEAMHDGAYDFLAKPFPAERLIESVRRAAEKRSLVMTNRELKLLATGSADEGPLIGQAPAIQRLRETLRHVAEADVDVLVVGETGLILGERFSGDEFAEEVLRRWRESEGRVAEALQALGNELAAARGDYQEAKQLDETLFAKDYESL